MPVTSSRQLVEHGRIIRCGIRECVHCEDSKPANMLAISRDEASTISIHVRVRRPDSKQMAKLLLYLLALLCGVYGNVLLRGAQIAHRSETQELAAGAPFLGIAVLLWLIAELIGDWDRLKAWYVDLDRLSRIIWLARSLPLMLILTGLSALFESTTSAPELTLELLQGAVGRFALAVILWRLLDEALLRWLIRRFADIAPRLAGSAEEPVTRQASIIVESQPLPALLKGRSISLFRLLLIIVAALASAVVWQNSTNNNFPPPYLALWIVSAILWALVFASPRGIFACLYDKLSANWHIPWRKYWWAYIAFTLIMILGSGFRLHSLETMPPEILNDFYFSLVDAYYLALGTKTPAYFTDNNGRPIMTLYLAAAVASLPGLEFDFYALKLSTALAGLLALPIMFWLGYEFIGAKRRNYAIVMGLLLSAFVAVSFWDSSLTRGGNTHALTSGFAALLGVFLIRAIRRNRRGDFVLAGLVLGFSLYTYHPARLFPLAVVAIVLIAMLARKISWRERLLYALNLAVLSFVAFMIFLPMFHFMVEYPSKFWRRAEQTVVASSDTDSGDPRVLQTWVSAFIRNVRNHFLMFNWKGDHNLEMNYASAPALDVFTGAMLVLGLPALGARMLKSRDPALWIIPALLAFMLLPSMIVTAPFAMHNIYGRSAGALPYIHLLAALPLALVARQFLRVMPKPVAIILASCLFGAVILLANYQNTQLYFDAYYEEYLLRSRPAKEGGKILRGHLDSGGAIGNSFIIQPGLGEARFIAAEAGLLYRHGYPNTVWDVSEIGQVVLDARNREELRLEIDRELFFLYSPSNDRIVAELNRLFPGGYSVEVPTSRPHFSYAIYRVRIRR